ncbi:hypothetical protein GGI07_005319 [Coemansia sp. Benny D115]|nr:hypothetical protein GGI07_005319 [Coemansia sp. Benny D115]
MSVDPTYYFSYTPANIAPEVAAGVFMTISLVLCVQTLKSRGPTWLMILSMTSLCEAIGYGFRTVCIYWTTLETFTAMTLFLLLPPNALALTNYKTLGEVIRSSPAIDPDSRKIAPGYFFLRPKFVTWFFFGSDVASFLLQAAGVGISTQDGQRALAKNTVLAGLAVQLFFFAAFLCIAAYAFQSPAYVVECGPQDLSRIGAKRRLFSVIIATTVLLYARSVYRVAEFVGGYGSWVYGSEWLFYLCDTGMVLASFGIYMHSFIGHHFIMM